MKNNYFIHKDNTTTSNIKKQYIEVPLPVECNMICKLLHALFGMLLLPYYLIIATILKTPGTILHIKLAYLALKLFILRRISFYTCYFLIVFPMDSTRYFEFHEVLLTVNNISFKKLLDVSSPRILPFMLMLQNKVVFAEMINPDSQDLLETKRLAETFNLNNRCSFRNITIEEAKNHIKTFDLITCISVLEHIPEDKNAIEVIWSLLCPGGHLILTLPCSARALEQYISRNDYGILVPGSDGYTFWQRYYDKERLESIIFSVTGLPSKMVIYGEREHGLFFRNATLKRLLGARYMFWRESYMMAKEYRYFHKINELPGEGVVMLEFIKP